MLWVTCYHFLFCCFGGKHVFNIATRPKENPLVAEAYSSIASVNMWDDHDIIDGYGSYPNEMMKAELFQGKYQR
jgi:hypothetical protein